MRIILIFTLLVSLVSCRCPPGTALVCADPEECLPFARASISVSNPAPDQVQIVIVGEEGMDFEILVSPDKPSTKYMSTIVKSRILGLNIQTSPDLIVSGRTEARDVSITLSFDVDLDIVLFTLSVQNFIDSSFSDNQAEAGVKKNLGFDICAVGGISYDVVSYEVVEKGIPCNTGAPLTLDARPGFGQDFFILDFLSLTLGDVFGNLDCIGWDPSAYFTPFVFVNDPITNSYDFTIEIDSYYGIAGMQTLIMVELIRTGPLGLNTINVQCLDPFFLGESTFGFRRELGKTYLLLATNPGRELAGTLIIA